MDESTRSSDAEAIREFLVLANRYEGGWGVPWPGPPVAEIHIELYAKGEFLGDFGVGDTFVTRTHGNFYSQHVPTYDVDRLRRSIARAVAPSRTGPHRVAD